MTDVKLVIITGMSGAGKTVAVRSFEDLGYFCVDNLPPLLIPKFLELMRETNKSNKVALVLDLRGREFFDDLSRAIDDLNQNHWISPEILFLDAQDEVLVRRYKETRRSHPLAQEGLPLEGIRLERMMLDELKGRAQEIIDTSALTPRQLRERIISNYATDKQKVFNVNIVSFGFKHGVPIDADLVFDVRFLPNPHYVDSLRPLTGLNEEVSSYVLKQPETQKFAEKLTDMLAYMLPLYKREGKSQLVIAIGCTGGQHRSVTLVEYLANVFESEYIVHRKHRDIEKRKDKK